MSEKYATVDEVIEILKKVSDGGKGHYMMGCNNEYFLAKVGDKPDIDDSSESVDLGGYC